MSPTPEAMVAKLEPETRAGMREFWRIYDAHYDELSDAVREAMAGDVRVRAMMAEPDLEQRRRTRELMGRAVEHDEWEPFFDDLRAQGHLYGSAGLSFTAWFDAVSTLRILMGPYIVADVEAVNERSLHLARGMHALLDIALAVVGEAYLEQKERTIREQQRAMLEMSTPVLQVRERLLLLPVIGLLDSDRARQLTEQLLRAISVHRALVVVVDVTGVPAVDSAVANHLIQTAQAAQLMGAVPLITGLSPENAQTLARLGIDLGRVRTIGDLLAGIEEAEKLLAPAGSAAA